MSFLNKVKKKLKNGSWYPFYNSFYENNSLDPRMILLESRSGGALESNILSLLKELSKEPYKNFNLVLSVRKNAESEIKEKLRKNSIQGVSFVHTGSISYYRALSLRRLSGQRFLFSRQICQKRRSDLSEHLAWYPSKKNGP